MRRGDGLPGKYVIKRIELSLFDMEKDHHETKSVIADFPAIAEKLKRFAAQHQQKFYAGKH